MEELEYKLRAQRSETVLRLGQSLIKWGALCFMTWRLGVTVESLAGRATLASFGVFLTADLKANTIFSHIIMGIFGLGGVGFGVRERSHKRREIRRLGNRVVELEKRVDPNRTSSGLTVDGRSRPEDEP